MNLSIYDVKIPETISHTGFLFHKVSVPENSWNTSTLQWGEATDEPERRKQPDYRSSATDTLLVTINVCAIVLAIVIHCSHI
jgi:hypothetical protein